MSNKTEANAFDAGFAETRGDELPIDEALDENEAKSESESESENPKEVDADSEKDEVETESKSEEPEAMPPSVEDILKDLDARTQAEVRKIYGKFGEIQQALNARNNAPIGKAKLKVSDALREEYSELAELMEGLEVDGVVSGNESSINSDEINARFEAVKQDYETKLLTLQHKDWREIAKSPDFAEWALKQDAETQDKLANSWDALFISEKLTEFKNAKSNVVKLDKKTNAARLEDAITPESKGAVKPRVESEDDAFASGFKAVRGL